MTAACPDRFDQILLSGYLDGELTQAGAQRVRIHLEDCAACRESYDELRTLREATMTTRLEGPETREWDESPRGMISLTTRTLGWTLGIAWVLLLISHTLWQMWCGTHGLLERTLIFGGVSRGVGWLVLIVWAVGTAGFGLWQLATGPENLAEKLMVFGGLFGVALLFGSILLDRLKTARTDRYREVQK